MSYGRRFPMPILAAFVLCIAVIGMVSSVLASAQINFLSTARHDSAAGVSATPASVQAMIEYPAVAASSVVSSNTDYTLVVEEELTPTISTVGLSDVSTRRSRSTAKTRREIAIHSFD